MSMFHIPFVRPRALQRPFLSVFVTIGCVLPFGSETVTVAFAIGLPVALSKTCPPRRPVPRTCAVAVTASASAASKAVMYVVNLRINPPIGTVSSGLPGENAAENARVPNDITRMRHPASGIRQPGHDGCRMPDAEKKKPAGVSPSGLHVVRDYRLEAEAGAEAEHARRLELSDVVRRGAVQARDVALENRLLVEDVERIDRQGQADTLEVEVLLKAKVDFRQVRVTELIGLVLRQDALEAFAGRDAVDVRDRITLTAGDVEAEARLDDRDLIGAGHVVSPLRVDVDAALRAAAAAGALEDFDVVANGAAGGSTERRRIDDARRADVLLPV